MGVAAGHDQHWLHGLQFGLARAGHEVEHAHLAAMAVRPKFTPFLDKSVPPGEEPAEAARADAHS